MAACLRCGMDLDFGDLTSRHELTNLCGSGKPGHPLHIRCKPRADLQLNFNLQSQIFGPCTVRAGSEFLSLGLPDYIVKRASPRQLVACNSVKDLPDSGCRL